jgi:hypothetical protein
LLFELPAQEIFKASSHLKRNSTKIEKFFEIASAVCNDKNLFLSRFSHLLCFLKCFFFNLISQDKRKKEKKRKRYSNKELLFSWSIMTLKAKEKGSTSLLANTSSTTCFA